LINNLKNTDFLLKFAKINVTENIFEYPSKKTVKDGNSQFDFLNSYPDPANQIIGLFLTPIQTERRKEIEKIQ
jgi:hypothetical protein